MYNIKMYQSSKYNSTRYVEHKFIYCKDTKDESFCLPLMAYLEELDCMEDIVEKICENFRVRCLYQEELMLENKRIALFELKGSLDNLIKASDIIGRKIIPIYINSRIYDIYIE